MPKMTNEEQEPEGEGVVVARLRKNGQQELVISLNSYKKHDYVDIRTFFGPRGEETKRTQKGVTIPVALYPEFRRLMEQLDEVMEDKGWA
jgi:hypothetical protein